MRTTIKGPHTNKHGQTLSCPQCGEINNFSVYRYPSQSQTHCYCPCGHYGSLSKVDDLPTHPKYRRTCTACGQLGAIGVQSLYKTGAPFTHNRCAKPRSAPVLCTAPDCTKTANRKTTQIPYKPMCTPHYYEQPGLPQFVVGQHIRNNRRWAARKAKGWRTGMGYTKLVEAAKARDNNRCVWCGSTERIQVDHIQEEWFAPDLIADLDNLQTMCAPCHSAKGNAVRAALYELARQNPLHYNLLADQLIAEQRTEKAH